MTSQPDELMQGKDIKIRKTGKHFLFLYSFAFHILRMQVRGVRNFSVRKIGKTAQGKLITYLPFLSTYITISVC